MATAESPGRPRRKTTTSPKAICWPCLEVDFAFLAARCIMSALCGRRTSHACQSATEVLRNGNDQPLGTLQ